MSAWIGSGVTACSEQFLFVAVEQSRGANIGTTLRCAVAFGADAFVIVGSDKYSTHGAHGAQSHIPVLHFFHWKELKSFVKNLNDTCKVYGLVCDESSEKYSDSVGEDECDHPIQVAESYSFPHKSVVLLVPNKKTGKLSQQQMDVCDSRLRTRFLDCNTSAVSNSIHLDVKVSICLQRYALYHTTSNEVKITEEKFDIDHQEKSRNKFLQLYIDHVAKTKAEEEVPLELDEDLYAFDNSHIFNQTADDY